MSSERYAYDALIDFASGLCTALGLAEERALTHAKVLVEVDLMGHTTHGLAMLAELAGRIGKWPSGKHRRAGGVE